MKPIDKIRQYDGTKMCGWLGVITRWQLGIPTSFRCVHPNGCNLPTTADEGCDYDDWLTCPLWSSPKL